MKLNKSAIAFGTLIALAMGFTTTSLAGRQADISAKTIASLAAKSLMRFQGHVENQGTYNIHTVADGFRGTIRPGHNKKYNFTVPNTGPFVVTFDINHGANACTFTFNTDFTIVPAAVDPVDAIAVTCSIAANGDLLISGV